MGAVIARRQLLAGTMLLLVIRLALAFFRTGPLVVADEVGYLTNARVLTGGVPGQMTTAPFYRGGYSLLIAPLLKLSGDPSTAYRLVLILNAVLAAAIAPLLWLLLVRCFRVSARAAVWPALAAAAYPSVTLYTQAALSENLLLPLTVVWLLCFGGLLDAPTTRKSAIWAAALSTTATALFVVHGRMVVAFALTGLALLALTIRRSLTVRAALAGGAVLVAGGVGAKLFDDFLVSRNYGGVQPNEVGQRLSSLDGLDGVLSVARNVVGQTWYLMVATLGVLVVFVVAGGLRGLGGVHRKGAATPELVLALLLGTGCGLLVVSALSFRDVERPDMIIYGRYVEVVVPPLLAVALARLRALDWRRALGVSLTAIGAATVAVVLLRVGIHPPGEANRWNVGSLPFLTLTLGPLSLAGAGVVASTSLASLAVLARRAPRMVAPALLALFLPTTAVIEHNPVLSGQTSFYPAGWTTPGKAAPAARVVAFDVDHHNTLYVDQWFMPHARFLLFSGSAGPPPAQYVISSAAWGREHPRLHARALWHDTASDHTLYRLSPAP